MAIWFTEKGIWYKSNEAVAIFKKYVKTNNFGPLKHLSADKEYKALMKSLKDK